MENDRSGTTLLKAASDLIAALREDLHTRSATDPSLADFVTQLSKVDTTGLQRGPLPPCRHPALDNLGSVAEAVAVSTPLAAAATRAANLLDWAAIYEGGGIEETLANGMFAAQAAGTYGALAASDFAAGLFFIAPGVHYPLHTHSAREIYYCMSGSLKIQHGAEGEPFDLTAGNYSLTPPDRVHLLETGDDPVLIVYCWIDDLTCPIWWWDRDSDGRWIRTAWKRIPGEPWKPLNSEPVDEASWAEAHRRDF